MKHTRGKTSVFSKTLSFSFFVFCFTFVHYCSQLSLRVKQSEVKTKARERERQQLSDDRPHVTTLMLLWRSSLNLNARPPLLKRRPDNLNEPIASRRADAIGGRRGAHTNACGRKNSKVSGVDRRQWKPPLTFQLLHFVILSPSSRRCSIIALLLPKKVANVPCRRFNASLKPFCI